MLLGINTNSELQEDDRFTQQLPDMDVEDHSLSMVLKEPEEMFL